MNVNFWASGLGEGSEGGLGFRVLGLGFRA